ncbi:uncharacterized protein LOC132275355 [Cornus florida]|uniref:uncharacterized protein LOC132275355 n=1 Tax=Cornus florida TaxID=4283 RepID=UPI00289A4CA8|nr:uncharacterized protein LOC132275355 [Cornus florida]
MMKIKHVAGDTHTTITKFCCMLRLVCCFWWQKVILLILLHASIDGIAYGGHARKLQAMLYLHHYRQVLLHASVGGLLLVAICQKVFFKWLVALILASLLSNSPHASIGGVAYGCYAKKVFSNYNMVVILTPLSTRSLLHASIGGIAYRGHARKVILLILPACFNRWNCLSWPRTEGYT